MHLRIIIMIKYYWINPPDQNIEFRFLLQIATSLIILLEIVIILLEIATSLILLLEMVGFQLSEEDIRHLTEEVTDAKGELSKNDFILHVKVSSVEIMLIFVIMMAVGDLANVTI